MRPMRTAPRDGSLIVLWIEDSLLPRFGFWNRRGGWVSISRDNYWLNGTIGWEPISALCEEPA